MTIIMINKESLNQVVECCLMSPGWDIGLKITPKQLWKYQSHQARYKKRYGRPESEIVGTIGVWKGVVFHE